jgi:hypothetical protein
MLASAEKHTSYLDRAEKPERCLPRCNVNSTAQRLRQPIVLRPQRLDLDVLHRRRPAWLR